MATACAAIIPYVFRKEVQNFDPKWDATYDFRHMTIEGKTEADETMVIYAQPASVGGLTEVCRHGGYDRQIINTLYDSLIYSPFTLTDPRYLEPVPA